MPTRILKQREQDLGVRFRHLQSEISRFSDHSISSKFEERFAVIDKGFTEVERRRTDVEANPKEDALYQRYLRKLLSVEADIEELELVLTHVELCSHHRDLSSDRVGRCEAICDELSEAYDLTANFLPVVQDSYALLPILDKEYYVVYLPRGQDIVPTIPILAHEVAHAIIDQGSVMGHSFIERFRELRQRMSTDHAERDFHENWSDWHEELFCDVTGFFAFGPSYVYAQLVHLLSQRPYQIQRDISIKDQTLHPPDALRYEVVTELADEFLPAEVLSDLVPFRREYRDHLDRYEDSKPSFYDDWADDQLVNAVINDGKQLKSSLDQLCDHLLNNVEPEEAPAFEYRIRANQYWLTNR